MQLTHSRKLQQQDFIIKRNKLSICISLSWICGFHAYHFPDKNKSCQYLTECWPTTSFCGITATSRFFGVKPPIVRILPHELHILFLKYFLTIRFFSCNYSSKTSLATYTLTQVATIYRKCWILLAYLTTHALTQVATLHSHWYEYVWPLTTHALTQVATMAFLQLLRLTVLQRIRSRKL